MKVAKIMGDRGHLTKEGISTIIQIKQGMNKGRPDHFSIADED